MPRATALLLLAALSLAGCGEDASKPYLVFAGGGFVYNYRIGEAFYGFVARPERTLPEGAVIEARFENPSGGDRIVVAQPAKAGQLQYSFKTPPLKGIRDGHDYQVELRVLNPETGGTYATYSKTFRTDVDQSTLPDKPLVLGPTYTPNPEATIPTQKP